MRDPKRYRLGSIPLLAVFIVVLLGGQVIANVTENRQSNLVIFQEEEAFLAATAAMVGKGHVLLTENFTNPHWNSSRFPAVVNNVVSQGLTWTSNFVGNGLSTGQGAAVHSGEWALFSVPHGQHLTGAPEQPSRDGFVIHADGRRIFAVGGWFNNNLGVGELKMILDNSRHVEFKSGLLDARARFFGIVARQGFSRVEIVESEGTGGDRKHLFGESITLLSE